MASRRAIVAVLVAAVIGGLGPDLAGQANSSPFDSALSAFWRASDAKSAADAAAQVLRTAPSFDALYARLKSGRPYAFGRVDDVSTPATFFAPAATSSKARRDLRGLWHPYLIIVPPTYDPTRRYPVRIYLQGDTSRPASSAESGAGWPNYEMFARDDAIVVFPGAWNNFPWWDASQVEHIAAILDELKRSYNVDENRVFLLGSSDGGTAIYYHALVTPTPYAAFLPFNGDPSVLAEPGARVDAQLHATNLANQSFFVVHGARDEIFPAETIEAWMRLFEAAGARVSFDLKSEYGHETRWWAEEAPAIDRFIADHPRDPLPDTVVFETATSDRFNRASWVIVSELGPAGDETAGIGPNAVTPTAPGVGIGLWTDVDGQGVRIGMLQPGAPANLAGLRDNDLIVELEGVPAPTFAGIETMLRQKPGAKVSLVVARANGRQPVSLAVPPAVRATPQEAFLHTRPYGRVEAERRANVVALRTRGVKVVTLLLSPERFDFSRPITIIANGTIAFDGMLTPSPAILMKWAARDNDRTMLFAQELVLRLP